MSTTITPQEEIQRRKAEREAQRFERKERIAEITKAIKIIHPNDGSVFEIRALDVPKSETYKERQSAYFNDPNKAADEIYRCDRLGPSGMYITVNELKPELAARGGERLGKAAQGGCTGDDDVTHRRWLAIDIDPERPSGISATDDERHQASQLAHDVEEELRLAGWSLPLLATSGNGFYLLYRIDLSNTPDVKALLERFFKALQSRVSLDGAKIDPQLAASFMLRIPGTTNRKGKNLEDRPHRQAELMDVPEEMPIITKEQIEQFADSVPQDAQPITKPSSSGKPSNHRRGKKNRTGKLLNVDQWLTDNGVEIERVTHDSTRTLYHITCPFNQDHKGKTVVTQDADGKMGFKCHGGSCEGKTWQDAKKLIGKPTREHSRVEPKGKPSLKDVLPIKSDNDPHRLARVCIEGLEAWHGPELPERSGFRGMGKNRLGQTTLYHWQNSWHQWGGRKWRDVGESEIRSEATRIVEEELDRCNVLEQASPENDEPPKVARVTKALITDVLHALASLCQLGEETTPPCWIDPDVGDYEWDELKSHRFVALGNGILDIDRVIENQDRPETEQLIELLDHTPNWFSPFCLPYEFDPNAGCPRWLNFLMRNLEGDRERIAILQEWFGYCLTPDTTKQKFLLMVGEGANGKSVACAVLTAMLGRENVSNMPLEAFGQRFALNATLGKLANIAAEVGELDKVAEGNLKAFTAGDRMMFEQKYRDAVGATPTARLVLATNNLPRFCDRSGGLWRRMILMPWRVTIPQRERIPGMDQPDYWADELPGIFNWSLAGLWKLQNQKRFTESDVCNEALGNYQIESNPARQFLEEHFHEHPSGSVKTQDVYEHYRHWCGKHGYHPLGDRAFGKEVTRTFPSVSKVRRGTRNDRYFVYEGVCEGALNEEN